MKQKKPTLFKRNYFVRNLAGVLAAGILLSSPFSGRARSGDSGNVPSAAKMDKQMQQAKLLFTENKGQVADIDGNARPDVLFTAHNGNVTIYLAATGIHYQFTKTILPAGYSWFADKDPTKQAELEQQITMQTHHFSLTLAGANPHPVIRKEGKNEFTENFYLPHCPDGITGVGTYEKLVYENVYPGIDWVVYSHGNKMKYDFVVHPGGDPTRIKLKINDAGSVSITDAGTLLMKTPLGEVCEQAPVSFADGMKVASSFKKNDDGSIGFNVAAVPAQATLIIDPSVTWATYYGGPGTDDGFSCATGNGYVYLTGSTNSASGIAPAGSYQSAYGGGTYNVFLVKFDGAGNRLWATYYGGAGNDQPTGGVVTDAAGNAYIAGFTNSATVMGSTGAYQATKGATQDAFLAKFSPAGTRLWGTYYGGDGYTQPGNYHSCTLDGNGNVYLAGTTTGTTGIATANSFQSANASGINVSFIVKFDELGARLWGTYFGGQGDIINGCAADGANNIYITGATSSTTNIASSGFQNTFAGGGSDAYLVKFNAAGARQWGTYYGGTGAETGYGCATDAVGSVYISGQTTSASGIAGSGFQNIIGGNTDAFLAKFDSAGNRRWGTYYGGAADDFGFGGVITDGRYNVYIAGITSSLNGIATSNGFQPTPGGNGSDDGFLAKLDSSGNRIWGSYYGGPDNDLTFGCAADGNGNIYLAGATSSVTGIVPAGAANVYQSALNGYSDAFLVKIFDTSVCTITYDTIKDTVCINQMPFTWNGKTITTGGPIAAVDTLVNAGGCDSIVTLNLFVDPGTAIWHSYTKASTASGLLANEVRAIAVDAAGNKWFATVGGLSMFNGTTWTGYTSANSGLAYSFAQSIVIDAADNKWVGTPSGVSKLSAAATWTSYNTANTGGALEAQVDGSTIDAQGNLWFCSEYTTAGSTGYGVARFDGTTWTRNNLNSSAVLCVTKDAAGNLWFGTTNGVCMYNSTTTTLTNYTTANGLANRFVYAIIIDAANNKWFCTGGGVSKFDGTNWTTYTSINSGLPNNNVFAAVIDAAGNKWFGTFGGGVSMFDGTNWTTYNTGSGLISNNVESIAIDAQGNKWFGTDNGVSELTNTCITCTPVFDTLKDTICASQLPFIWNGKIVTAGGVAVAVDSLHNTGGCDSIVTLNLVVKPQPAQPLAFIDSSLFVCQGQTNILYKVPNDSTVTYNWSYTGTGATVAATGDSAHVSFGSAATNGTISVTATAINGCGISTPRALAVTVSAIPVVSITGNGSICTNGSTALIASGATTYSWSPSATLSSATGDSVQASPTATTAYTVTGTTSGCSDTVTTTVTVNALPKDTVIVYAPGVVCPGSTLLLQTTIDTGYHYQWQLNGTNIPTAVSAFYSADSAGSYDVRITASSGAGCTITTHQVSVTSSPAPTPVIIYMGNGQLCAAGFASYQWYMDGTALAGDTSSCVTVTTGGDFTVIVTSAAGCTATSPVYHLNTGVGNVTAAQVKLYPNPATSIVNISAPQNVNVSLSSIDGRELMHVTNATTLNISSLPNAVYLVKVYDQDNNVIKIEKLVVSR